MHFFFQITTHGPNDSGDGTNARAQRSKTSLMLRRLRTGKRLRLRLHVEAMEQRKAQEGADVIKDNDFLIFEKRVAE